MRTRLALNLQQTTLPQPSVIWDYRFVPPCLDFFGYLEKVTMSRGKKQKMRAGRTQGAHTPAPNHKNGE